MRKKYLLFIVALFFCLQFQICSGSFQQQTTYSVITAYGKATELTAANGEKIIKAGDGTSAYKVKTVPVRNEQQLLDLMGAKNETELTDLQRGLLETYRFSQTSGFSDLAPRVPDTTEKVTLNLFDIAGYEDTQKYPTIKNDFWPVNASVYNLSNNRYVIHSEIRISGTDCLGYGPASAERMKGTYAHEFGHALDLTAIENNAYGFDETHYVNEKIQPKASFAEGFANFIKWLFFDDTEEEMRDSLRVVRIERPEGGYDDYPVASADLKGQDFLNIEAINTLIFTRLASELPDGQTLVLDSFQKHNHRENRMSNFLQNFIKDYPQHSAIVAGILDRETGGRLADAEIRQILGSNAAIEHFIASRKATTDNPADVAAEKPSVENDKKPAETSRMLYKWKDDKGKWNFTDQPPPAGIEFTRFSASPDVRHNIEVQGDTSNPFALDY